MVIILQFIFTIVLFTGLIFTLMIFLFRKKEEGNIRKSVGAMNQTEVVPNVSQMTPSQIRSMYLNSEFTKWLHKHVKGILYWKISGGEYDIAYHYEGIHVIDIFFTNGYYQKVMIKIEKIPEDSYKTEKEDSDSIYKISFMNEQKEAEDKVSPEELCKDWLTKFHDVFTKNYKEGTGFSLPVTEMPDNEEAVQMVFDYFTQNGTFITSYNEDRTKVLFAYAE